MKKILFFLQFMLCFHFGAKAQNYRLLETVRQGNSNNSGLVNQNRTQYEYNNTAVPFDFPSVAKYENFDATNNVWVKTNKVAYSYDSAAPNDTQLEESFEWINGNYSNTPNAKSTYTYSSAGVNTQKVILSQSWDGTQWVNQFRQTTIKNNGKVISLLAERYNMGSYFTTFEVNITYNANNQPFITTTTQYDYSTGTFLLAVKSTNTYDLTTNDLVQTLEQRKNTANATFFDFARFTYSYFNGKKIEVLSEQPQNNNWVPSGLSTFIYAPYTVIETIVSYQNFNPNTPQNSVKLIRIDDQLAGKISEETTQHWINNAWTTLEKTNYYYGTGTTASIDAQVPTIALEIYPNPTTESLRLRGISFEKPTRYAIYNMQGGIVQTGHLQQHENSIDVIDLPSANYVLNIDNQSFKAITFTKL